MSDSGSLNLDELGADDPDNTNEGDREDMFADDDQPPNKTASGGFTANNNPFISAAGEQKIDRTAPRPTVWVEGPKRTSADAAAAMEKRNDGGREDMFIDDNDSQPPNKTASGGFTANNNPFISTAGEQKIDRTAPRPTIWVEGPLRTSADAAAAMENRNDGGREDMFVDDNDSQPPNDTASVTPAPGEEEIDRTPPRPTIWVEGPIRHSLIKDLKNYEDPEEEKLKRLADCCEAACLKDGGDFDDRKKMSSEWFAQINLAHSERKPLCFAESLLIMEDNGETVGKMYCHVTPSKWGDRACLCVNSESYGKFTTGLEAGTSITSFVNFKVRPLQEYVYEWASLDGETIERKTLLIDEVEKIHVKITTSRNGTIIDTKNVDLVGIKDRENLVTEGPNIILQRLLILQRRTAGSMIVQSLAYTGKVVRAKYSELGSGWENVRGAQVKTWGIRRITYVNEDDERQFESLFNKYGRLILRCQPDSPQALIPLWFEGVYEFDKFGNFTGVYSPYAWACDAELHSKYLVKKEALTYDHRRYITDNPEVRALLSDYLQSILFRKPQNVYQFTKQFFEAFMNLRAKAKGDKKAEKKFTGGSSNSSRSTLGENDNDDDFDDYDDDEFIIHEAGSNESLASVIPEE